MKYTSVDRVLAKLAREIDMEDIAENDTIEMIGEAMEGIIGDNPYLGTNEEAVAFIEVKNYKADIPPYLKSVIQVARDNSPCEKKDRCTPKEIIEEITVEEPHCDPCKGVILDCQGNPIIEPEYAHYRPYFDLKWEYEMWTKSERYKSRFTPIRLANHSFYNTLVCSTENDDKNHYNSRDEYNIQISTNQFILSFPKGHIAVAYVRQAIDEETGYPLIPDNYSYLQAISSYVKFKIAQRMIWSGRQGFERMAQKFEADWHYYNKQAWQNDIIPNSVDDFENIRDARQYLAPRKSMYNSFFGNLANKENR